MRILSGKLRGREIPFRPQPGLRPTHDRARKAVIDSLASVLRDAEVLDLFSGTGAMGFEAASAGAARVVFVESDRRRANRIDELIDEWDLRTVCRVQTGDVFETLPGLMKSGQLFHAVFADPPYEQGFAEKTLNFFKNGAGLHPGAYLAIETYKKEVLPEISGRLQLRKKASYGDTHIHYYILS